MIVQTPAQRLAEAQTALHQLRIGKASVVVKFDGREVHYNHATVEVLQGYVDRLACEVAGAPLRRPGAIGILFG